MDNSTTDAPMPKMRRKSKKSVEERLQDITYSEEEVSFMTYGQDCYMPREILFQLLKRAYDMGRRDEKNKKGEI